jgi:hypothetical protein
MVAKLQAGGASCVCSRMPAAEHISNIQRVGKILGEPRKPHPTPGNQDFTPDRPGDPGPGMGTPLWGRHGAGLESLDPAGTPRVKGQAVGQTAKDLGKRRNVQIPGQRGGDGVSTAA